MPLTRHSFTFGQRVRCVADRKFFYLTDDRDYAERFAYPRQGAIYTVRNFDTRFGLKVCMRLCEIVNAPGKFMGHEAELAFDVDGFDPVEDAEPVETVTRVNRGALKIA